MNMLDEDRGAAQRLTQGPDSGKTRQIAKTHLSSFPVALPGLFLIDSHPTSVEGELGLPRASMASGVGGMGIHWGASCPRPTQSERIGFISREELDRALDHAELLLGVRKGSAARGLMAKLLQTMADEFDGPGLEPVEVAPIAIRQAGERAVFSGTGVILGDLETSVPGFELRADTLARRVVIAHDVAVGAELEDRRSGEVYLVHAARVVVCADGLRTPQLLFASGVRPPALGHYFNEHFQMNTLVRFREGFNLAGFDPGSSSLGSVRIPFSDSRPMQGAVTALASSPWNLPVDDKGALNQIGLAVWYGSKDIQHADSVQFSHEEADFYGMPKMRIQYEHTAKDRQTIDQLRALSLRTIERIGTPLAEPALAVGGSSIHYQGAVRMGAIDDGTSVCDDFSRVWGVENLYVGGNGVIPTATASNPTLTAVALAWRAARRLGRDLVGASSRNGLRDH